MAIKPDLIATESVILSKNEIVAVERAETYIDEKVSGMPPGQKKYEVSSLDMLLFNGRIENELRRRYKVAGWKNIEFEQNPHRLSVDSFTVILTV